MITAQELRKNARERELALDLVEKDYVLGWMLFGIVSSSISAHVAFKGGSALSKIYFPGQWRLSEDLDFTILDETDWTTFSKALANEVPARISESSGIMIALKKPPHTNPSYLQSRFQYQGPIAKNTIKVEISKRDS